MPTKQDIVKYYQFSKFDYQLYNMSLSQISMHYGIWDNSTKSHKQALLNENGVLAEIANITANDSVIDFGCGYGISDLWLADNKGCKVTGITIDPVQITFAKKLLNSADYQKDYILKKKISTKPILRKVLFQ